MKLLLLVFCHFLYYVFYYVRNMEMDWYRYGTKGFYTLQNCLDGNWYYPWIQCGIMMTISFTYRTSLSVCSWTQADMIFYKWLCKIITQSSLIAKITRFHKISNFSTIANLALVWTVSWIGCLFCVFVCWHKNKYKFYKYIFLL